MSSNNINEDEVYKAPESELQDENQINATDSDLASRGVRLGAAVLDSFISIVFILPGILFMVYQGYDFQNIDEDSLVLDVLLYSGVLILLYMVVNGIMLYKYSQTIGKRLLNIKIVRSDGSRIAFGRLIGLRIIVIQVLYYIPLIGTFIMIVNLLFIFREDHKCLHDLIADTKVIEV